MAVLTALHQDEGDPLPRPGGRPEHWGTWDLVHVRCQTCDWVEFTPALDPSGQSVGPGGAEIRLRRHWSVFDDRRCELERFPDEFYVGEAVLWRDGVTSWPSPVAGEAWIRAVGQTAVVEVCGEHVDERRFPQLPPRDYRADFLIAKDLNRAACARLGIHPVTGEPLTR
jgi:hypothetical protein